MKMQRIQNTEEKENFRIKRRKKIDVVRHGVWRKQTAAKRGEGGFEIWVLF